MTSLRELLIGLLTIITRSSASENLRQEELHHQICQPIPSAYAYDLGFGYGAVTTYRPYILPQEPYTISPDEKVRPVSHNYTLYKNHVNENCSLALKLLHRDIIDVLQVSPTKLFILASWPYKIFSEDMRACSSKLVSQNVGPIELDWRHEHWIYHAKGFEATREEKGVKIRVSYDEDGNQVGQPRPYLLQHKVIGTIAMSHDQPRSGNFIARYVALDKDYVVSLVDADGRLIKQLLSFDAREQPMWLYDNYELRDSRLFAFCWPDRDRLSCAQFDEFGNEVYRNSTEIANSFKSAAVGVISLIDGGVVFVAAVDSTIRVLEMRPGRVSEKTYLAIPSTKADTFMYVDAIKYVITDFNEDDREITIRGKCLERNTRYSVAESKHQLCWYTLSSPSRFE